MEHLPAFLTVEEAAYELRISEQRVRRLMAEGRLGFSDELGPRLRHIPRREIERLVAEASFQPEQPTEVAS